MIEHSETIRRIAYIVVAAGIVLSSIAAVVPFENTGYKLMGSFLFLGLAPYVIYGALTDVLKGYALLIPGLAILGIDLIVKVQQRFFTASPADSNLLVWVPIVLAVVVLPAGIFAGRHLSRTSKPGDQAGGTDRTSAQTH
jgi:hypothetical protein